MNDVKKVAGVSCEVAGNEILKAYKLRVNMKTPLLNAKYFFGGFLTPPASH